MPFARRICGIAIIAVVLSAHAGAETRADLPLRAPLAPVLTRSTPPPATPPSTATTAFRFWFQLYRATLSKSRGRACNFSPSCSHYSEAAIERYGVLRGLVMTGDRLMRCHPPDPQQYPRGTALAAGGSVTFDPVEDHDVWWCFRFGATRPAEPTGASLPASLTDPATAGETPAMPRAESAEETTPCQ